MLCYVTLCYAMLCYVTGRFCSQLRLRPRLRLKPQRYIHWCVCAKFANLFVIFANMFANVRVHGTRHVLQHGIFSHRRRARHDSHRRDPPHPFASPRPQLSTMALGRRGDRDLDRDRDGDRDRDLLYNIICYVMLRYVMLCF